MKRQKRKRNDNHVHSRVCGRLLQQGGGVDAAGQLHPGEEAAVRIAVLGTGGEIPVDALEHHVPAPAVQVADHLVVGRVTAPLEELRAEDLGQHGGVGVGGGLHVHQMLDGLRMSGGGSVLSLVRTHALPFIYLFTP